MPDDKLEREQKLEGMGTSRLRKEDARFIRGQGSYVDDIKLPGMLFGAIVRSPYAHARIKAIDKSAALKVPGVVAVLTADDLKPVKLHWMPTLGGDVQAVLADTKVCFQYQEVAFVLAQDRYAAADGADAVVVDYEELPAIVDPKKSMAKDAPIIREDIADKDNVGHGPRTHPNHIFTWDAGDKDGTDAVFANAPVTVREEILNPRVHPCPLETCGCVASFDKVRGAVDGLSHLAGAASRAHRRRDAVGHPGEQDPHRRRRHRRRLRQQGAGVSGLRRGDRRLDRHRRAGEVDRIADRQHLDHRLRARLSRRRRAGRGQGRPDQGAALYRACGPWRVQFARVGDQAAGRAVQHLHRLVRDSEGVLPRRCGLHEQGAGRRGVPLFAARHRGGLPDRADDRRPRAEARTSTKPRSAGAISSKPSSSPIRPRSAGRSTAATITPRWRKC